MKYGRIAKIRKKSHVVVTSINSLEVLRSYYKNIRKAGLLMSVKIWVVGDRKTPSSVSALAQELTSQGLEVTYLDIPAQDAWGARFPKLYSRIPYDNETRRNIGYLHAFEEGCERLISIDDDNWPTSDNFLGGHSATGMKWNGRVISEPTGYHNICEHLVFRPVKHIFPRGYPFSLRNTKNKELQRPAPSRASIGVTCGLWLNDPDIDAVTWLNGGAVSTSFRSPAIRVLNNTTWSPINTQNTSVAHELIPAFFCIPMGWEVPGGKIQRYGDIWGGYFLQSVLRGTRYHVAFGKPLVRHIRNPHNHLDDMRYEYWGMMLTDWLVNTLRIFKPQKRDVISRMIELSRFLAKTTKQLPSWCTPKMCSFITYTSENISLWAQACRDIKKHSPHLS